MKTLWPVTVALLLAASGCSKAAETPAQSPAATSSSVVSAKGITGDAPESVRKAITEHIKLAKLPAHITAIQSSGMPNVYWVSFEEVQPVFISGDGQYLLQGDLHKLGDGTITNLSTSFLDKETKRLLTSVADKDMIIFSPAGKPKAVVYAFTDVDCGYCRKLHSEIEQINAKGIEVRYLAWPRGQEDVAINKAVWCSEDRKSAITTAKNGLPVKAPACNDPVDAERLLGNRIGVNGTPAIYNAEGHYLSGYLPADDLAKKLNIK